MSFDLTNKNISDTFQNLLQKTGSGNNLYDLKGNEIGDLTIAGALHAQSYIVSQSTTVVTSGSTVFGSFKVASLIQTSYVNDANTTVYEYNSFTITLPSAATGSETGGGFNCFVGPLNERP